MEISKDFSFPRNKTISEYSKDKDCSTITSSNVFWEKLRNRNVFVIWQRARTPCGTEDWANLIYQEMKDKSSFIPNFVKIWRWELCWFVWRQKQIYIYCSPLSISTYYTAKWFSTEFCLVWEISLDDRHQYWVSGHHQHQYCL